MKRFYFFLLCGLIFAATNVKADGVITIRNGDLSTSEPGGSGYSLATSGQVIIEQNGAYTVKGADGGVTATTTIIVVNANLDDVNITLENVNINAGNNCAFSIANGTIVHLTLVGANILKSGASQAGLSVPETAALTISGSGSLTATGGSGSNANEGGGAGIGGAGATSQGEGTTAGDITINSGTIVALGGAGNGTNAGGGAGIGGGGGVTDAAGDDGDGGNCGVITISGGIVLPAGGSGTRGAGANVGIGGGTFGSGVEYAFTNELTIDLEPANATVTHGSISGDIFIEASINPSLASFTYQWFKGETNVAKPATDPPLLDANEDVLTIPTNLDVGNHYFYCVVSAENAISMLSDVAVITVDKAQYNIKLEPAGGINFGEAILGYSAQTPQTVTVINIGAQSTGELEITLDGDDAFELSVDTLDSIDEDEDDSFDINPKDGLEAGTYSATVTVSGNNGISASISLTFKVTAKYEIELDPETVIDFGEAKPGYVPPAAVTVTVNNTGDQPTGVLDISLNGDDAFTLSELSLSSIDVSDYREFTVQPKADLAVGKTYSANVEVSGGNGIFASLGVTFEVIKYEIDLIVPNDGIFPERAVGYSATPSLTVTVVNTGTRPTGLLNITLAGGAESNFTLSRTTITDIDTGEDNDAIFTVSPKLSLGIGTYTETVTVSGDNGITASYELLFKVIPVPVYGIEIIPPGDINFGVEIEGYTAPAAQVITIKNIGNQPTGELTVALVNDDNDVFELSSVKIESLLTGASANFSVGPKSDREVGVHTATVRITNTANGINESFNVKFEVKEAYTPFAILTKTLPPAFQEAQYSVVLEAKGAGVTWSIEGNPAWLHLNTANGVLSGRPALLGTTTFKLTARNSSGETDTKTMSITVCKISIDNDSKDAVMNKPLTVHFGTSVITAVNLDDIIVSSVVNNIETRLVNYSSSFSANVLTIRHDPFYPLTSYKVFIPQSALEGMSGDIEWRFTTKPLSAIDESINPMAGSTVFVRPQISVKFDGKINNNIIESLIYYEPNRKAINAKIFEHSTLIIDYGDINLEVGKEYRVTIEAGAIVGLEKNIEWSFHVNHDIWSIVDRIPGIEAENVKINEKIDVWFNAPIVDDSFKGITIVSEHGEQVVIKSKTLDLFDTRKRLTIDHEGFDYETRYTVTIPKGAVAGMVNDQIWSFTTDHVREDLNYTTTEPSGNKVDLNAPIVVTFNKPIQHRVTLYPDHIFPYVKINNISVSNTKLIITHDGFAHGTEYTVTIPSGMVVGYVGSIVFRFTTLPSPKTNVEEIDVLEAKLFPNPVNAGEKFEVQVDRTGDNRLTVELFNASGVLLHKTETADPQFNLTAPGATGVYLLRITDGNKTGTYRLVVQ